MNELIITRVFECVRTAPNLPITTKKIAATLKLSVDYIWTVVRHLEKSGKLVATNANFGSGGTKAYTVVDPLNGEKSMQASEYVEMKKELEVTEKRLDAVLNEFHPNFAKNLGSGIGYARRMAEELLNFRDTSRQERESAAYTRERIRKEAFKECLELAQGGASIAVDELEACLAVEFEDWESKNG